MSLWRYNVKTIIATKIPTPKTAYAVELSKETKTRKESV